MAHEHSVYDTDPHFSINENTRVITDLSSTKTTIIQNDHNSERFTFEMPRYIDGHDMTLCDVVQVHYVNVSTNNVGRSKDVYDVTDLIVDPENDEVIYFTWLVPNTATRYEGSLSFGIHFACTTDKVDYAWNTAIYSGVNITRGIYHLDVPEEEVGDTLMQWQLTMLNKITDLESRVAAFESMANAESMSW